MADGWFRFYNTALEHPKVLQLTDAQFRVWLALLSMASKMDGIIPDNFSLIAVTIRKTMQKARDAVQVLISAGLLDRVDGGFIPHNWNVKQFKSDSSTERVKRFRNGHKSVSCNASGNGPETETETETEEEKDARMARFNDFWEVCPKKKNRDDAEKAWRTAIKLASPDVLIAGMQAYARRVKTEGTPEKFTKTPGPWLNTKRWREETVDSSKASFEDADLRGWESRLRVFREKQLWSPKWGPKPGEIDCKCPAEVLEKAA